jgi:hypothetical protein
MSTGSHDGRAPLVDADNKTIQAIFGNQTDTVPNEIQVLGAGSDQVNGVYKRVEPYDGAAFYAMEGPNGLSYIVHFEDDTRDWCVSSTTDLKTFANEKYFYVRESKADQGTESSKNPAPPQVGWVESDEGEGPVPIIHCIGSPYPQNWRVDPELSFTDWKIIVQTEIDGKEKTMVYNCHRSVLALGPRACKYFWRLFESKAFSENEAGESRIQLHCETAEELPVFLDFCYGADPDIHTENSVFLLYLASYFDCTALYQESTAFCNKAMSMSTCGHFYKQASICHMADTVHVIESFCVQNVPDILKNYSSLVDDVPLNFWVSFFAKAHFPTADVSEKASELLVKACWVHQDTLELVTFQVLAEKLTHVSYHSAARMLDIEARFLENSDEKATSLTSLQTKCIAALASNIGKGINSKYFQLPEGSSVVLVNGLLKRVNESTQA